VHSCPGGDSRLRRIAADIGYAQLLPLLFELARTSFNLQYASEKNKTEVLEAIRESLRPGSVCSSAVTDVLNPRSNRREIRDLILEAAEYIPPAQLGTTTDCGFSPFAG